MTNHYVATIPVKFTDTDGQERTRFQRVGAMFRNTPQWGWLGVLQPQARLPRSRSRSW